MQKILGCVRAAVDDYRMIEEGDRIAIGVSGGKDSVLLLASLARLQRFYPLHFSLEAVTLDMRFGNTDGDFSGIRALCEEFEIPYTVRRTELAEIIFEARKEQNPCSLCARMRRGILHDLTKELSCNKLALGHHLDDAAETFLLNLLHEGRIGCFSPVTYLSRKDITMIRPLVYLRENEVENAVRRLHLPVLESRCPANEHTSREDVKKLLRDLSREYGDVPQKITGALQRSGIDRW